MSELKRLIFEYYKKGDINPRSKAISSKRLWYLNREHNNKKYRLKLTNKPKYSRTQNGTVVSVSSFFQQATFKARFFKHNARTKDHLIMQALYLTKEGKGKEGKKAKIFSSFGSRSEEKFKENIKSWFSDRHHFRFVLSPENSDGISVENFGKKFFKNLEKDLKTKLQGYFTVHYDTGIPHIHYLIRGIKDDGTDLVIDRYYLSHGARNRAREMLTKLRGLRSKEDVNREKIRAIRAERLTRLDMILLKIADKKNHVDLWKIPKEFTKIVNKERKFLNDRIKFLTSLGLISKLSFNVYVLNKEFTYKLKALSYKNDVYKKLSKKFPNKSSDKYKIYDYKDTKATPITGKIIDKGVDEELGDKFFLTIDASDGNIYHTPIGKLSKERILSYKIDSIVTVFPKNKSINLTSLNPTILKLKNLHSETYNPNFNSLNLSVSENFSLHKALSELNNSLLAKLNDDGTWKIGRYLIERIKSDEYDLKLRPVQIIKHNSNALSEELISSQHSNYLDFILATENLIPDFSSNKTFKSELDSMLKKRMFFKTKHKLINKEVLKTFRLNLSNKNTAKFIDLEKEPEKFKQSLGLILYSGNFTSDGKTFGLVFENEHGEVVKARIFDKKIVEKTRVGDFIDFNLYSDSYKPIKIDFIINSIAKKSKFKVTNSSIINYVKEHYFYEINSIEKIIIKRLEKLHKLGIIIKDTSTYFIPENFLDTIETKKSYNIYSVSKLNSKNIDIPSKQSFIDRYLINKNLPQGNNKITQYLNELFNARKRFITNNHKPDCALHHALKNQLHFSELSFSEDIRVFGRILYRDDESKLIFLQSFNEGVFKVHLNRFSEKEGQKAQIGDYIDLSISKNSVVRQSDYTIKEFVEKKGSYSPNNYRNYLKALNVKNKKFDKNTIDFIVKRHVTRLESLIRLGLATKTSLDSYTVKPNFIDTLERDHRVKERYISSIIKLPSFSKSSIELTEPTIFEKPLIYKTLKSIKNTKDSFSKELLSAFHKRQKFLKQKHIINELDLNSSGVEKLFNTLRKRTLENKIKDYESKYGSFNNIQSKDIFNGTIKEFFTLADEKFVVIKTGKFFTIKHAIPEMDINTSYKFSRKLSAKYKIKIIDYSESIEKGKSR